MIEWHVQNRIHRTAHKHAKHQDATVIQKITVFVFYMELNNINSHQKWPRLHIMSLRSFNLNSYVNSWQHYSTHLYVSCYMPKSVGINIALLEWHKQIISRCYISISHILLSTSKTVTITQFSTQRLMPIQQWYQRRSESAIQTLCLLSHQDVKYLHRLEISNT